MKQIREIIKDKFVGEVIDNIEYNVLGNNEIVFKFDDGSNLEITPVQQVVDGETKILLEANVSYLATIKNTL